MKPLYLILFAILPSALFAQSNYYAGYVLKTNGDTLKGFINYREWEISPKVIDFKINKGDSKSSQFTAENIKGFEVTGLESYVSYTGIISLNKTGFSSLQTYLDTTEVQSTLFLKQLAAGSHLSLFYNNDELKKRYFIAGEGEAPTELKYYQYYITATNLKEIPVYRNQLAAYVNKFNGEDAALMNDLKSLAYSQGDLESLVNKINGTSKTANNSRIQKSNLRFFAGLGANATQTRFFYGPDEVSTSWTVAPKINLGLDFLINPTIQQFIFRTEISFSYVHPNLGYIVNYYPEIINYTYSFNQFNTSVTPQLLFNFYNKDSFKIYADVGVSFNLSFYSENKFSGPDASTLYPTFIPYSGLQPFHFDPYWISFQVQLGFTINKRTDISLAYSGFSSYTSYENTNVSNRSASLGVKYLFGKN